MERTASLLGCVWSGVPRVLYVPWSFFLNACGISSPTRVKSRWTLLSYIGGIVTLPCPVTTRSSVPGSTVRATSPGYRSPPPHPLWCQRDGKAKLVPELQAPPPNQSPSAVISHPPTTVVTLCLAFPRLSFGSSRWFSVCVEKMTYMESISLSLSFSLRACFGSWMGCSLLLLWCLCPFPESDVCLAQPLLHHWAVSGLNMQNSMPTFLLRKAFMGIKRHTNIK